jgi:superfamily II DNA/RNA helicase
MPDLSRDELLLRYMEQLPYPPYPVQEEALYAWASSDAGVMLCAPTGTGKTLVAEAALYEALHDSTRAYYTTPLIALTEQKFHELQAAAVRWGFSADDVGMVTGNRTVNPEARVLVVVAEILLNRLLHREAFDFSNVSAVVMDEFHSFADAERGIVWEMSLTLLPPHVRLMLLSATVGNASEFMSWLRNSHKRDLTLVQGTERKVPLTYHWVGDELLGDQLTAMARGEEAQRRTPALVFCFDRNECWNLAEQLKGKDMLHEGQQKQLVERIDAQDWSDGAGPKLSQILKRGVGIHHAGLLPRYRRIVEELFQEKLLSVCVCTETLAAGINLPARSVVLTELVKGPPTKKKVIEASSAHQMFGRAGRPQFDTEGHVYVIAHEDDVKIARWREKYDSIPEDTKDPGLMKAKKALKKKQPTRRQGVTYWNEEQFTKLQEAPPGKLYSKGRLPWRLLAHVLEIDPRVSLLRDVVSKRLMDAPRIEAEQKHLTRMLVALHRGGFVELDPPPPAKRDPLSPEPEKEAEKKEGAKPSADALAQLLAKNDELFAASAFGKAQAKQQGGIKPDAPAPPTDHLADYQPEFAKPLPRLKHILSFRSVDAMFGTFLLDLLGVADLHERVQIFESLLEMPGSVARNVRVPWPDDLPPGTLAVDVIDPAILKRGLATAEDMYPDMEANRDLPPEMRKYPIPLAEKVRMYFDSESDLDESMRVTPVWAAGDLLNFGGDFNTFVRARDLIKQEGILFRHLLRMILLCGEFAQHTPSGIVAETWQADMKELATKLTESCRRVDPDSTDKMLEQAHAAEQTLDAM